MPSTLENCEKLYGTRDIYELLGVEKEAQEKEIKKAYYKLSLIVHPDRVGDKDKDEANEKFKTLGKIYSILSDANKRALYDEQGIIDDDDDSGVNWVNMWQQFFKPITENDILQYEKEYVGSERETADIKRAYVNGKGCKNYMWEKIPFMKCSDEPRVAIIVQEMIEAGEVPDFAAFTKEPRLKTERRHKREVKEAKEADKIKEKLQKENEDSLANKILARRNEREAGFGSFLDKLAQKYGGENGELEDDDEEFDIEKHAPKKRRSAAKPKAAAGKATKKTKAK